MSVQTIRNVAQRSDKHHMTVPVRTPGVVAAGYSSTGGFMGGRSLANTKPWQEPEPVHGQGGWMLAKYEWRDDGSARFLYVRNTGERREVHKTQRGWL